MSSRSRSKIRSRRVENSRLTVSGTCSSSASPSLTGPMTPTATAPSRPGAGALGRRHRRPWRVRRCAGHRVRSTARQRLWPCSPPRNACAAAGPAPGTSDAYTPPRRTRRPVLSGHAPTPRGSPAARSAAVPLWPRRTLHVNLSAGRLERPPKGVPRSALRARNRVEYGAAIGRLSWSVPTSSEPGATRWRSESEPVALGVRAAVAIGVRAAVAIAKRRCSPVRGSVAARTAQSTSARPLTHWIRSRQIGSDHGKVPAQRHWTGSSHEAGTAPADVVVNASPQGRTPSRWRASAGRPVQHGV
jgi:hypothetical protein